MAKAISVDEMTIVNCERMGFLPKRGYRKVQAVGDFLGLEYADLVERVGPSFHDSESFGASLNDIRRSK